MQAHAIYHTWQEFARGALLDSESISVAVVHEMGAFRKIEEKVVMNMKRYKESKTIWQHLYCCEVVWDGITSAGEETLFQYEH